MEHLKEELDLLKKSFPFIKFTIIQPESDIRILINTRSPKDDYWFWYYNAWRIQGYYWNENFNEFLDNFIFGLIKHKVY